MDVRTHYQRYWKSKNTKEEFYAYERNLILPPLFHKGEKVLDLGCGDGVVAEFLKKEIGVDVTGADISNEALRVAKKRGIKVKLLDVENKLPFKDNEFDTVFWGDNVEHLFSPEDTLTEIKRVLKKGGRLILSCPNYGYWRYRFYFFLKGQLPDTEWTGNPPWAWSHIRFFNKKIINEFLLSNNFIITNFLGVNKRFPDRLMVKLYPELFGMVMVVEAKSS